jgi:hypothetical protein
MKHGNSMTYIEILTLWLMFGVNLPDIEWDVLQTRLVCFGIGWLE